MSKKIRRLNPYIFFIGIAVMVANTYADIHWLPIVAGVLMAWPICFMIWDYKENMADETKDS